MNFFKKARGILGINARNLDFIEKYNSTVAKRFADDKIFTKQFLEPRGIRVAKLYNVISNYTQLTHDFFESLPETFVIKPNRGFGGGGIIVILRKKGRSWITASGKKLDEEFLYRHCISILDGKYSISGMDDKVIFEERLEPHPSFRKLTDVGLPDVRLIIFNLVPVLAMLRVPTYESEGKANMELGAVGLGVDIGTGRTTGGAMYSHFVKKLPNGHSTAGFQIPFWDQILAAGAKIQNVTHVGFVGADFAVTRSGPKVLEINARAGLKIQIANQIPLKDRLEKVTDLKVVSPEEGVEIAKTLFSSASKVSADDDFSRKPILGIEENVILNSEEKPIPLKARIDLSAETNVITAEFFTGSILDVTLQGKRVKLPVKKGVVHGADLLLAGKFLTDFYIDPNKKSVHISSKGAHSQLDEKMIHNMDEKICEMDEQIKLLFYINPRNLAEQKALFLANPESSPHFFYHECDLELEQMRRDLKRLPEVDHQLFSLFQRKREEIEQKMDLIEAVGGTEFEACSEALFTSISEQSYRQALAFVRTHRNKRKPDQSAELDTDAAKKLFESFLRQHKLTHWKVKIIEDTVADVQVTKRHILFLRKGAVFHENRLKALLVHEIGTHVFRFENGKQQPFRIFERGTSKYLQTEEGLAVWNQNQLKLNLGEKFFIPAYQILAIHLAKKLSFRDLFHYLLDTYDLDSDMAWKLCVKAKRGYKDTDLPGAFTKDALYFFGNQEVEKFLAGGGKISDLYLGKISVRDVPLLRKIEGLQEPKFLL